MLARKERYAEAKVMSCHDCNLRVPMNRIANDDVQPYTIVMDGGVSVVRQTAQVGPCSRLCQDVETTTQRETD